MWAAIGSRLSSLWELAVLLPWLVGLFVWSYNVVLTRKLLNGKKPPPSVRSSETASPTWRRRWTDAARSATARIIPSADTAKKTSTKIALALLIPATFALGYFYRDHQELENTMTFHDVKVLRREAPARFLLATAYTGPWWVTLCSDYQPPWQAGYRLKLLVYEDRGCKRLSGSKLGYVIARDEHGNPIIESESEGD